MLMSMRISLFSLVLTAVLVGSVNADCPVGDLNGDCQIDFLDVQVLAQEWLTPPESSADINGDDRVDIDDFALLAEQWHGKGIPLAINEIMASNSSCIEDPQGDYDDWIEIYNFGDDAIDIGRMYLTDNLSAPIRWRIPDNNPAVTTIPSQGYLLIWADGETNQGTLHASFKLSADGEEIGLFDTNGSTLIDGVTFGPQDEDYSYGRLPDGGDNWQVFASPTPGQSNKGKPIEVLVNEIMYHPYHTTPGAEDIREEYIELFNRGDESVSLSGWRLSDGVDFVFPDVMLGAGEYLVVAADVNTFTAKYPDITKVVGGWVGRLSNSGEAIRLNDDMGVTIDRVRYADQGEWAVRELGPLDGGHRGWLWTEEHDGDGKSLELVNPALLNEYGQNWKASAVNGGTPGMVNSVADANIAPLIVDVEHFPIIPGPNDPVIVTARIFDELTSGITVTLHYRVDTSVYINEGSFPHHDPGTYTHLTMSDNGAYGDGDANDGIYGAQIPGNQADGTIIEFYIEATDDANSHTWPAPVMMDGTPEQVTNALYQVDDSFDPEACWVPGSQPIYYIVMTEMERARMRDIVSDSNLEGPNCQMNVTFISADGVDIKVRYNVGVRNRGHGTRNDWPNNYRVNFAHDRPWEGVTAINLNVVYTWLQLAANAMLQMSGVAQCESTAVQVRTNGENLAVLGGGETYGSYVHLEVIDTDFADNHYTGDDAGNAYKCMRIGHEADLRYEGTDPNSYRHNYFKRTNTAEDDWSDLITLTYALSDNTPDETYVEEVNRVMNTEQWLRFIAINALMNNRETTLANGNGDDYYLYRGIEDPRFVLIQHDLDSVFGLGQNAGSPTDSILEATDIPTMKRFLEHPQFISRYYWHLKNLIETTFSAEQFGPFLDNLLAGFVPTSRINQMKTFVAARNLHVLSLIPSELTVETDLPQSNGYYLTNVNTFSLYGTADPVETRSVLVNGQSADWSAIDGMWDFGGAGGIAETLVHDHSVWKYLDDGSDQGIPSMSTEWFGHPDYSDSLWLEGPAELGYGDASQGRPEATVVNSGPDGNYFITTYFRHSFNVNDASQYSGLRLRLLYDDGVVVYLNGIQAARRNMPGGDINFLTRANNNISGTAEYTFSDLPLDPNLLSTGINVLAVEIHQSSSTSADISFDLRLDGIMPPQGAGALWPGINRVTVETFDGPNGMGNKLKRGSIDIWYDDGDISEIFGTLAADTTLDANSGPWHVMDDIIVPAGMTLTIEPGTTLFFDTGTGIIVQQGGRLIAEGTEYSRIRLTAVPGGANWDGIKFDNTLQDNRLTYIDMEFGDDQGESVDVQSSRVLIDNMTWSGTNTRILNIDHPSVICRNSVFPSITSTEPLHGIGLTGDEYIIFDGCIFGTASGYSDIIDFRGAQRPGPILQLYNSIFLGGGDDGADLDSTDAHIEGNVFMNFNGGGGGGTANAVATGVESGDPTEVYIARNIFINNDHAVLLKEDCFLQAQNNVFVGCDVAVVSFGEPYRDPPRTPGKGTYMEGNIFWNNAAMFEHFFQEPLPTYGPTGQVVVEHSSLPFEWHYLGLGNIDADPLFVDDNGDFRLKRGSGAIGMGAWGLDMGAMVPSGAAISGEPYAVTYHTDATLTVGGPGITHYKYSVNNPNSPWSAEYSVDVPVELTGLVDGESYTVYAIGKNSAGTWQSEDNPTASRTWTIDTSYSRLVINEVLAHTHGSDPDLIELYYDGPVSLDLSGMSLTDEPADPKKFVFSSRTVSRTIMDPGDYIVLYGDLDTHSKNHIGFALSSEGEGLYLYDKPANGSGLIDSVRFGPQINNFSIGRIGYGGTWKLNKPTLGQANIAQPLGNPDTLKINEWFTNGQVLFENDFIELFNPHAFPVDLSSLYLTDNPVTQPDKHEIVPLSFVEPEGYAVFRANDGNDPWEVDFKLSADGEMIGLFDSGLNLIDQVLYGPQTTDVSQGRAPNGSTNYEFFALPTPGVANTFGDLVVTVSALVPENAEKRAFVPTSASDVNDTWNSDPDFDDSSWMLCIGGPGGVGYEENSGYEDLITLDVGTQMHDNYASCYIRIPFTVDGAELAVYTGMKLKVRYDDGFVAYVNGAKIPAVNFTGTPQWDSRADGNHEADSENFDVIMDISDYISELKPGNNVLAIHSMNVSAGSSDFIISAELDVTTTTLNEEFPFADDLEVLAGLRITELMYHAEQGSNYDYVELQNISDARLNLEGVQFTEGIEFVFPAIQLGPGQYVVVVSNLAAFRSAYGTSIKVAGEYSGNLSNGDEEIILTLAWPLEAAILRFVYSDRWYPTTDGGGNSLVIYDPFAHPATWRQPESWQPASPTPGR